MKGESNKHIASDRKIEGFSKPSVHTHSHVDKKLHLLESAIASLPIGILLFDANMKIIESNKHANWLAKTGEHIDKSLTIGCDNNIWGNWTKLLKSAIAAKQATSFDSVHYTRNGKSRLVDISCAPLNHNGSQENLGGVLIAHDVTERNSAQQQVDRARRMIGLEKMAANLAHELNNPLDGILRYVNLAIRVIGTGDSQKAIEYLEQSRSGLTRMAQIVTEQLTFAQGMYRSAGEKAPVDRIIAEAVRVMEDTTSNITIDVQIDRAGRFPHFDSLSLFQVFCNLIKNALSAMADKGTLKITTSLNDNTLRIAFVDTGPGFPPQHSEMIFEPFFTTDSSGRGTGLGLAICKDILDKLNGTIIATNNPEQGSTFTVCLPVE